MIPCGIAGVDALFANPAARAVDAGDRDAVGAVQELLIGHGFKLPGAMAAAHGTFGPQTTTSVQQFQTRQNLAATGAVDAATMRALASVPATTPIVSRPYTALVLDVAYTGLLPLAAVTMQFEGGGRFAAANRNTDQAGLSFGLIQWAQKPGRLHELLQLFQRADAARFTAVFGAGDAAAGAGLLAHTAKPNGGIDPASGQTTDPRFDLIAEPWRGRFLAAALDTMFQRVQLTGCVQAFTASARKIRATMPIVATERGLAFMLDVANQFGDGGAHALATAVLRQGMDEAAFLRAVQDESVTRVERQHGAGSDEALSTRNRREAIRATRLLSDAAIAL